MLNNSRLEFVDDHHLCNLEWFCFVFIDLRLILFTTNRQILAMEITEADVVGWCGAPAEQRLPRPVYWDGFCGV
jgi:hypothetical protein